MPNTTKANLRTSAILSALRAKGPLHLNNVRLAGALLKEPGGEEALLEAFTQYVVEANYALVPLLPRPSENEVRHAISTYLSIINSMFPIYPLVRAVGTKHIAVACSRRWSENSKELEHLALELSLPPEEAELERRLTLAAPELLLDLAKELKKTKDEVSEFLSEPNNQITMSAAVVEHWLSRAPRIVHKVLQDPEVTIRARADTSE